MHDRGGDAGVVDGHHHIWRLADLPWLNGPVIPRIFGRYEPIQRDYLATDYTADAVPHGVTAAVYVQANWPLDRCVAEVRWLRDVHERTGWPSAVVGSADLFGDDAPAVMRDQAALTPLMRGVRLQLHWHETRPEFRFADGPDRMNDPALRRNVAALADLGWLFELQVFPAQAAHAARFAAAYPDTTFVLVHAGMLVDTDPESVRAWTTGLRRLADQPNVVVKLSGQGTFVHRVDPALIDLVTGTCLELFGPGRCMWGSNFPIEKLWTDYGTLLAAWRRALDAYPPEVRDAVLAGTARHVYRLP